MKHIIDINVGAFNPQSVVVHIGDTLEWVNKTGSDQQLTFGGKAGCPADTLLKPNEKLTFSPYTTGWFSYTMGTTEGYFTVS